MSRKVAYTPAATKSIVNAFSTAGFTPIGSSTTFDSTAKTVLSGAMTAGVLKTILSINGQGTVSLFGANFVDGTSRTMRIKVTIDGTVAFDYTSAANAVVNAGVVIVGSAPQARPQDGIPIRFNSSILFEAADSLSETDKLQFSYKYLVE